MVDGLDKKIILYKKHDKCIDDKDSPNHVSWEANR